MDFPIEQVKQLYLEGLTLSEIGLKLGYSPGTINNHLDRAGVPKRRTGPQPRSLLSEDGKSKTCSSCGLEQPIDQFPLNTTGKFRSVCKSCKENTRRIRRYKLSSDEIQLLLKRQKYKCKICLKPLGKGYHIDHNHKTDKVRGILCGNCNRGLGLFYDDPNLLKKAEEYLIDQ